MINSKDKYKERRGIMSFVTLLRVHRDEVQVLQMTLRGTVYHR